MSVIIGAFALPVGFVARHMPLEWFPGKTDLEADAEAAAAAHIAVEAATTGAMEEAAAKGMVTPGDVHVSLPGAAGQAKAGTEGLPLVDFSAQPEPFLSLISTKTTQRVPQKVLVLTQRVAQNVLTSSRNVDACKAFGEGELGQSADVRERVRGADAAADAGGGELARARARPHLLRGQPRGRPRWGGAGCPQVDMTPG